MLTSAHLLLCELYPAIQGEGKNLGSPCLFIRTFGCNLQCDFKHGGCDSAFSWDPNVATKKDQNRMTIEQLIQKIKRYKKVNHHWILTGGEPMLQQQNLTKLIRQFKPKPYIEWETNGTIVPTAATDKLTDQYNVSLKLSNSMGKRGFNTKEKRLNKKAITYFVKNSKAYFKFVIDQPTTLKEVEQLKKIYKIANHKIWLMPEGINPKQLSTKTRWLLEYCRDHGYNFSPRLHIMVYRNKRKT